MTGAGIKYDVKRTESRVEKNIEEVKLIVENVGEKLRNFNVSETKIKNFEKSVEEKKFKIKREFKVEKIIEETEEYKSTISLKVGNDSNALIEDIMVLEVIPKDFATSALEINSDLNFIIIEDDPILQFIIPTLSPGEEINVVYFVDKEVDENTAEIIDSVLSFESEVSVEACYVNTSNAEYFEILFDIDEEFIADVNIGFVLPYSDECMALQNVSPQEYDNFECGAGVAYVQDAIFESIGLFTYEQKTCTAQYASEKLILNFWTRADTVVGQLSGNAAEIMFKDWNFVESSAASRLAIKLPSSVELVSFYPKADPTGAADYELGIVSWEPIPSGDKKPTVRYSIKSEEEQAVGFELMLFLIVGIGVAAGLGVLVFILMKGKTESKKAFTELHDLNVKMKQLEKSYLVGKVDEVTYRRLMEQYQLERNELQVKIKKAAPKETKKENNLQKKI